jgi:hypothetical protein
LIAASVCIDTSVSLARTPCAWCLLSQTSCTHKSTRVDPNVLCVASTCTSTCSSTCASMSAPPCLQFCQAKSFTHWPADMHIHNAFHTFRTSTRSGRCQTFVLHVWPSSPLMWPRRSNSKSPHALAARKILHRPVHPLPMAQARGSSTHARPSNSAAVARYVDEKEPVCLSLQGDMQCSQALVLASLSMSECCPTHTIHTHRTSLHR